MMRIFDNHWLKSFWFLQDGHTWLGGEFWCFEDFWVELREFLGVFESFKVFGFFFCFLAKEFEFFIGFLSFWGTELRRVVRFC